MGGYREGSGRAKTGYYKGIYCGSTYELCWVIYQLDHGNQFTRFTGCIKNDTLKYFPDFLVGSDHIVEIKGYEDKSKTDAKTQLARDLGYTITVLYKTDLVDIFTYVRSTYNTRHFYTLYDAYKPKYTHTCTGCGVEFSSESKRSGTFHSRECAGRYHTGRVRSTTETAQPKGLTRSQAIAVYNSNLSYSKLGDEYGLTKGAIGALKSKKTYKWIHDHS